MVLSGCTASQIGELAGLSKATVTGWVKTADEQGFDALRSQQRSGRPSKLSKENIQQIDALLQTDPKEYGYKVWDGPTLASHIKNTFGVELSIRQCQRLFHNLGYSLIRPQPYPSKGYEDSEERENFKKKRNILESDDSLILVYQDEVHFQIQTTIMSGWYKKGSSPTVKSYSGRYKASYSGFVIPNNGVLFVDKPKTSNYETTIDSIRAFLLKHPVPEGKKYALVMDNAPWHKKRFA